MNRCKRGWVYVVRTSFGVKIGYSCKSLVSRLADLDKRFDFEFLFAIETHDARGLETFLHRRFSSKRQSAWWSTEMFAIDQGDLDYMRQIAVYSGQPCHILRNPLDAEPAP